MLSQSYSYVKILDIARNNYKALLKLCELLEKEGYWDKPKEILKQEIQVVLDMYIQAHLLHYARYCSVLSDDNLKFIFELSQYNLFQLSIDSNDMETLNHKMKKNIEAPPILLQLCGLRDIERQSGISGIFFDTFLNLLVCYAYATNTKGLHLTRYVHEYYSRVSSFLNITEKNERIVNEKYIFLKISSDDLESNFNTIQIGSEEFEPKIGIYSRKSESSKNSYDSVSLSNQDRVEKVETKVENQCVDETSLDREKEENLSNLLNELNSLVGLTNIKEEVNSLINLIKIRKLREEHNLPVIDMSFHMVFTGNPGTGKTTVARLISKIYKELGLLSKGNLVETDRSGLVAGYVGQTALKVKEVVESAIGGVLFIDEAYSLTNHDGQSDYGIEAVDTLVKLMEDHRDDLIVIVAGYKEEMKAFLRSNTGLISRFNRFMEFVDYRDEELIEILKVMALKAGYQLEEEALLMITSQLAQMSQTQKSKFGNARGIRNVFEKIIMNQANRIVLLEHKTVEELMKIVKEDVKFILD